MVATKKSATSSAESTVVRITANDSTVSKPSAEVKQPRRSREKKTPEHNRLMTPLTGIGHGLLWIGRYFKGSWQELREVRWPDRRATWGLTGAVIAFSAFFVIVILLLDALFKYVFQLILGQ